MNTPKREARPGEMREVALLAALGVAVLYCLVGFLNATIELPGGGLPVARLCFFGPACGLAAALFFIYAWRVYFRAQCGPRAGRALAGLLLLHLGLNLVLFSPLFRK